MDNEPLDPKEIITEVTALLNAAWNTRSETRYDMLVSWARESLKPLVDAKYPEALWLFCSIPSGEHRSEEEFDRQHMIQVRAAAEAGSASARFHLACELDAEPTIQESAELFKAAAEQGHSYSKWCHGLNLLSGRGIEKNEALGLRYIEDAANSKFEGAIQFLCNAYTNGTYGYPKDAEVAASWWAKLKDKDVIPF